MKHQIRIILFLAVTMLIACGTGDQSDLDPNGLKGKLVVTGSSTVAPLATEMAMRFEKLHPGVRIDVQTGGSGKGIADTRTGIADIGMASRPLKNDEVDLQAHQIAADGVGLILHASNPITELRDEQIVGIYTGVFENWSELGGEDEEITVVHKAEGRATLEVFLNKFGIQNPQVKADVIVGDNEHGIKTVAGLKGAIGYVSIGTAEADLEKGIQLKLLPLDGIEASTSNVASGLFPMSRPLNFITTDSPSNLAKIFIEFCKSEAVQDLVAAQYFVSV